MVRPIVKVQSFRPISRFLFLSIIERDFPINTNTNGRTTIVLLRKGFSTVIDNKGKTTSNSIPIKANKYRRYFARYKFITALLIIICFISQLKLLELSWSHYIHILLKKAYLSISSAIFGI